MPEAEELFIDAARHATEAAQGMWRRWRAAHETPVPQWLLEDCRLRLELLVEAMLGLSLRVRNAQLPAPIPWMTRLLRHAAKPVPIALPANDGCSIYLPPYLAIVTALDGSINCNDYPLLALLQALRVARGSAAAYSRCDSALAADLFQLAEAAAVDRALRQLAPGWNASLDSLYARNAGTLERRRPQTAMQLEVVALYSSMLRTPHAKVIPLARNASAAFDWANDYARSLARGRRERYLSCLEDMVIGRLLPAEAIPTTLTGNGRQSQPERSSRTQRAMLVRRPRVRQSEEDEDESPPGAWMVQTSEPQEHAEDPFGLNRPQDRDTEGDAQARAQSLEEMETARLVSTPGRASEVMSSDDPPPRSAVARDIGEIGERPARHVYPEWDCRIAAYQERATHIHVAPAAAGDQAWVQRTLDKHAGTLRTLKRRLGVIRPHRQVLRRQPEGDDIDCDALVDERNMRRAGGSPSGLIYLQHRRAQRRIGMVLLIDASASTDAWVADGLRVIDVEKEAALVAACALETAGMQFAVLGFSGEGQYGVQIGAIKEFMRPWDSDAMRRIAGLEPDRYTRLGGALRHGCAQLVPRPVDFRMLLLFSDGKPNDCDLYASKYGLEDARQALNEARAQHIEPYCFTVDREAGAYLPHLFGAGHYTIVQRAQQLPVAFIAWLRNVVPDN